MNSISTKFRFTFSHDGRGYGWLKLYSDGEEMAKWWCRSGSCKKGGILVNNIPEGIWTLRVAPVRPVDSEYNSMYVKDAKGEGWKARMWTPKGAWSHFLIHPDGGLPGTQGCIAPQKSNAMDLRDFLAAYFKKSNSPIAVEVGENYFGSSVKNKPKPEEEEVKIKELLEKVMPKRIEVNTVKKAKVAEKGIGAGLITYISLLIAKHLAPELEIPVDETAGAVALLIGGIINFIKHKKK